MLDETSLMSEDFDWIRQAYEACMKGTEDPVTFQTTKHGYIQYLTTQGMTQVEAEAAYEALPVETNPFFDL